MDITKKQFVTFSIALVAIALFLAILFKSLAAGNEKAAAPEIIFLAFCYYFAFVTSKEGNALGGIICIYGGSLLFCFFYLFIAPLEAPVMILLFLLPALLFQKKKISGFVLALLAAVLMAVCYKLLGRPAVFVLLFPTCHLISMRFSPTVSARFTGNIYDVGNQLSQKQKKLRAWDNLSEDNDWWDILKPEIDKIAETFIEKITGEVANRSNSSTKTFKHNLLQLQDSASMSKALTDLKRRDKDYDTTRFLKKVDKIFVKIQEAWYGQKPEEIQHLVSDALFEQFQRQKSEQEAAGIKFKFEQMRIEDTRIAQINSDENFDVIHVFIRASSIDSLIDIETKEELAKNEDRREFAEYWTFLRRPSAKTLNNDGLLDSNCPNCGNPIKIGQVTVCEICNSYLRSGEYDWVLAKITQASEWEYSEPDRLPDWDEIKKSDKDFTVQAVEDLGAVIFWKIHEADRTKNHEIIQRFTTPELGKFFSKARSRNTTNCSYVENIALGSVRLQAIELSDNWDKLYLLITWNGVPVRLDREGKILAGKRTTQIYRDVYVMVRKHGAKSNLKSAITSAHCPHCGGGTSSSFATSCEYCGSVLNEGTKNWILDSVTLERNAEYLEAINRPKKKISDEQCLSSEQRSAKDMVAITTQILLADGVADPNEVKLLKKIAGSYGMTSEEVNSIINSVKEGIVHIPAPANAKQAWELLLHATRMALADGHIDEDEERSLVNIAKHIGYTEMDIKRAKKVEEKRFIAEQKKQEIANRKKANQ